MSERPDRESVFIVGCGDIGRRVARLESAEGLAIRALARSETAARDLEERGIDAVAGDLDRPETLPVLPEDTGTLYYFAPPPPRGTEDPRLRGFLRALTNQGRRPRRIVYIGSSGVYGDCGGAWVDEERPLHPGTDRARRRADAERQLSGWGAAQGVACVVLRVAGIYGPGRLPVERIRQGLPILRGEECPYSNRIHADDLAAACVAAARLGQAGRAYNISDGHPTTLADYFCRVADLYGLPHPPRISLDEARRVLSPELLSFLEESRRLSNRRMRQELRVRLRYPDLASGLPACLAPLS